MVFDLPLIRKPFEERYALMKKLLKDIPYIKVVKQSELKDLEHLYNIHNDLVKLGAEGTVLHHKKSFYENKRSKSLLKLVDKKDSEVKVVDYEFGKGRNQGRLGALIVKWLDANMGKNEFKS